MVDVLLKAKVKVNEQAGMSRFALKFLFYDRYDIDVSLMMQYCNSLKYSGNNKIAIIAAAHMRYCKIPVFIKFLTELAAAVPVHRYT